MLYILLSVIFTASLVIILKLAQQNPKNDLLTVIVVNYWTATLGALLYDFRAITETHLGKWTIFAIIGGLAFIILFFLIGYASHKIGAGYTGILFKISLVIPVIYSVIYYGEPFKWNYLVGILLAIISIVLINYSQLGKAPLKLLLFVGGTIFLGSGLADVNFKFISKEFQYIDKNVITFTVFLSAAIAGSLALIYRIIRGEKNIFNKNNLGWGLVLGISNYLSLIFFLLAINKFAGTLFFPINHVGTVLMINFFDILIFKPKLTKSYIAGLIFAVLAIGLLSLQ